MTINPIKSFSIYGLFGTTDVHIPLDEPVKILVGENGLGKTQVLNLFYYTLTQNFSKLKEYNFDRLVLTFSDGKTIEFKENTLPHLPYLLYEDDALIQELQMTGVVIEAKEFATLKANYVHSSEVERLKLRKRVGTDNHNYIKQQVFQLLGSIEDQVGIKNMKAPPTPNNRIENYKKEIQSRIKGGAILYFPTFRRVQEDLHNLGYGKNDLQLKAENTLIRFGMDDVQKKFNQIQEKIDKLLKEGLAQFTKDLLNTMTEESEFNSNDILNRINESEIAIILARVGSQLPDKQKVAIRNIVRTKQFKNPFHAYLLQKLFELYEKQTTLDHCVKLFKDICNKYLINKQIFYDESNIKIFVKSDITDEEIPLSKLSSGEKQIVSIFSKIYLSEADEHFIVLFDEPELSLSMLWQRQLLPDIVNSQKCNFLLAVTHSPFIFDNELDKYAIGLDEYTKPIADIAKLRKSGSVKSN
ncbi:MAG: hypothetical protein RIS64_1551 [Bacteroidota bacterium]|jgi:predicted ATPase